MQPHDELLELKRTLRLEAEARRAALDRKDELSRAIWDRFAALSQFAAAATVMLYVHIGDEVRTQPFVPEALAAGKRVVVPYCVGNELELFNLQSLDELAIGTYGILEPRLELRAAPGRRINAGQIDLVLVPGVAFDRRGGRLGHGRGFYDRLLPHVPRESLLAGAAFECQLFDRVPMGERDVFLDLVITEKATYER